VVLREKELALPIEVGIEYAQLIAQQLLLEQLLFQPERDRHTEGAKSFGSEGKIGFEQALELEKWLVIEGDVIDFAKRDAALVQTISERMVWKTRIMLLAREALLLGGGNDLSIDDQRRCTIVIERRQSQNSHSTELVARIACR
jgi:hypothetical protein